MRLPLPILDLNLKVLKSVNVSMSCFLKKGCKKCQSHFKIETCRGRMARREVAAQNKEPTAESKAAKQEHAELEAVATKIHCLQR